MSRSPERISSYRRHFEDSSSSSSAYQVRVSSPSPTRRDERHASSGYSSRAGSSMRVESVGRRTASAARRSTRMVGSRVSAGAMVCVGPSGEPAIDLDAAAAENQEFLSTRTSERQEMIVLNDRLAVYINKVRSLEQQNKLLEAEIEAYQNRFEKPTGLRLLYEEQLKELNKIADQMRVQRDISLAAKESTAAQLEAMKIKYEEAVELRKKAELDIEAFRPDVDKATSSRIALEKKLEQLEVEIEFLKRIHQQEIDELMKQIYAAHVSAQSAFTLPDLAAALKQIQSQYDDIAAKNLQEMDSWYKNKFEDLTQKTSRHVDKVRGFREEIAGAKKDIQGKERDLDSMRSKNDALEAQIREMQEKYKKELEDLQARIEALQLELKSTKEKIALHLREYQDLLNIKMALEIEITTYRKLIEGEDLRLSGMVQTLSLASCSVNAIGAGMSVSGGGVGGVSGVGGGLTGGSSSGGVGGVGGVGSGVGRAAGGSGAGQAGLGGRMGAEGINGRKGSAGKAGGVDATGGVGLGAGGGGVGVGASVGGVGAGAGAGAGGLGVGGLGTGPGGLGTGPGGLGTGPNGLGVGAGGSGAGVGGLGTGPAGLGTGPGGLGVGAGGSGAGVGGLGTGPAGLGTGPGGLGIGAGGSGAGVGGLGTGPGGLGVGPGGLGTGPGGLGTGPGGLGSGAGGLGTGPGGLGIGPGGLGTGPAGLGTGPGAKGDSGVGRVGMGAGSAGFSEENGVIGKGIYDGVSGGISGDGSKVRGTGPAGVGGGIGGSGRTEGMGVDDIGGAPSGPGGIGKIGGGMGDVSGARIGYGSDGYDGNIEAYAEQAVELTERRTVLIRTVKSEDDVLEMDHQEQTYTITGAADDSDNE